MNTGESNVPREVTVMNPPTQLGMYIFKGNQEVTLGYDTNLGPLNDWQDLVKLTDSELEGVL